MAGRFNVAVFNVRMDASAWKLCRSTVESLAVIDGAPVFQDLAEFERLARTPSKVLEWTAHTMVVVYADMGVETAATTVGTIAAFLQKEYGIDTRVLQHKASAGVLESVPLSEARRS